MRGLAGVVVSEKGKARPTVVVIHVIFGIRKNTENVFLTKSMTVVRQKRTHEHRCTGARSNVIFSLPGTDSNNAFEAWRYIPRSGPPK